MSVGSIARTVAVIATSPVELIKTRLQSAQSTNHFGGSAVNLRSIWTSLALHKQVGLWMPPFSADDALKSLAGG